MGWGPVAKALERRGPGLAALAVPVFGAQGVVPGQVLLTSADLEHRASYLNARNTLERLLSMGAVPVINENDTVATTEIRFGDNDRLEIGRAHV